MNERELELLNKIKKIHKKLEEESGNKYEITIKSNNNPNLIVIKSNVNPIKEKTMEKTSKFVIENMTHFKELEDTYDSLEEIEDIAYKYCKVNGIKPYIRVDLQNGLINYGKGRLETIGKIRMI